MEIILASGSPRRRELMKLITEDFTAVSVDADETVPEGIPPMLASEYLATIKALAASLKNPEAVVIGCDTTVIADGEILGKPADKEQCRGFMELLSGRKHQVVTGVTLMYGSATASFSETTDVTFRKLTADEIEAYISTDEPYDKAGGYGIQGRGALLVERINGDYFNVVGLPVSRLNQELNKFISSIKE
ncbi:MAG: septum formation protein Maf [Ruminococcus sp.]|nr:septum formation protein Maf [Ruminococcus sp.]